VQMLGRGTRLCPEIEKGHFTVFDCFDGTLVQYFSKATDFELEAPQQEPVPLEEVIENIYQNIDRDYFTGVLIRRLQRINKDMSGNAREQFAEYVPEGDMGKFAAGLRQALKAQFTATMKLLRNSKFQNLLLNYERAKRTFVVGYPVQDEVTSAPMLQERPQDYLDGFVKYVRENADAVAAFRILLKRPKAWNTKALGELRQTLREGGFREKDLQDVHRAAYGKDLVDIISMVKHAAREEEPVLTAPERVDRAMARVTEGKSFTAEQTAWLQYIREHLVRNLTIGLDDFDAQPVLQDRGGRRKAERVFGDMLGQLIEQINYAVAA